MFFSLTTWLVLGAVGGLVWGLCSRWARLPVWAAVALAPAASVAMVLEAFMLFLATAGTVVGVQLWSAPMLAGAGLPAMVLTYLLTRRTEPRWVRKRVLLLGIVLMPGVFLVALGLPPASLRYADEIQSVKEATRYVDHYVRQNGRCPTIHQIPHLHEELTFSCHEGGYGFCIWDGGFDPVECWSSNAGNWSFERRGPFEYR